MVVKQSSIEQAIHFQPHIRVKSSEVKIFENVVERYLQRVVIEVIKYDLMFSSKLVQKWFHLLLDYGSDLKSLARRILCSVINELYFKKVTISGTDSTLLDVDLLKSLFFAFCKLFQLFFQPDQEYTACQNSSDNLLLKLYSCGFVMDSQTKETVVDYLILKKRKFLRNSPHIFLDKKDKKLAILGMLLSKIDSIYDHTFTKVCFAEFLGEIGMVLGIFDKNFYSVFHDMRRGCVQQKPLNLKQSPLEYQFSIFKSSIVKNQKDSKGNLKKSKKELYIFVRLNCKF